MVSRSLWPWFIKSAEIVTRVGTLETEAGKVGYEGVARNPEKPAVLTCAEDAVASDVHGSIVAVGCEVAESTESFDGFLDLESPWQNLLTAFIPPALCNWAAAAMDKQPEALALGSTASPTEGLRVASTCRDAP
jgi:hypothetical protein